MKGKLNMAVDEKTIQHHMKMLGISREEAIQLAKDDERIDKGEKLFELEDDLKAGAKKARQADRKPTVYKLDSSKRKRKEDTGKREIINALNETLTQLSDNEPTILNPEREIEFFVNGKKYKVTLSAPRS